jgi:hypothetical protein
MVSMKDAVQFAPAFLALATRRPVQNLSLVFVKCPSSHSCQPFNIDTHYFAMLLWRQYDVIYSSMASK